MIEKDSLVRAIFEALKNEKASPEERRLAILRAAHIAQAYQGETVALVESVFGS